MDDNDIKQLFSSFEPRLTSDILFMSRLERRLEAVEIVKQYQLQRQQRNRRAVVMAALAGVVVGFLMALFAPAMGSMLASARLSLSGFSIVLAPPVAYGLPWLLIAGTSVLIAMNVYDLTSASAHD